jgi:carbamoyl-phosphate synthase large subunit
VNTVSQEMLNVLVTGAGGPAGVAVIRSLLARADVVVFAADMDGWAAGLYLVPAERRRIVPRGDDPSFVDELQSLCSDDAIDVLFSTVDVELPLLAARRAQFASTVLAAPSLETLDSTLDKFALAERVTPFARVPVTRLVGPQSSAEQWEFPIIVKPRRGAGSRGVRVVHDRAALDELGDNSDLIAQEFLPGEEFSVDVFADSTGAVVAAVPRTRTRVDSGVSIAGRTVRDDKLETTASDVARAVGLTGVANVQLRYDRHGEPALLEVNPRFPGAMPLTIAAGVDMPSLALDLALGRDIPSRISFREVANVRYLEDVFLDPAEILHSDNAAHGEGDE